MNFKTNDLAMVAVLKYEGHKPIAMGHEMEDGRPICYWTFAVENTRLEETVAAFKARKLTVEPIRFSTLFGDTKTEMYNDRRRHR